MNKFIRFFRSRRAVKRLTAARLMAAMWEQSAKKLQNDIAEKMGRMEHLQQELQQLSSAVEGDIRKMQESMVQQQTAVESLREENRILSECTIPVLTGSHTLLLERYNAEIAIMVRQGAAVSGKEE